VHDMGDNKPITRQARAHSVRMGNALNVLLSMDRTMPLQLAWTFLHVACGEGLTASALATQCNVSRTVMSRHLRDLGSVNRHRKAGLGLIVVTRCIHGDLRERHVTLTQRGVKVARRMIAALQPVVPMGVATQVPTETDAPRA
jgi:DNA-binding MarR family transcriptional regulator